MKAIITFNTRLEFDIDEKMRDKIIPDDEQVKRLKSLFMVELDCEHVGISEYRIELQSLN